MHRIHAGFTMAVAIKEGHTGELRRLLKVMNVAKDQYLVNFGASETTLFVSGVILPAQDYHGEQLPETFVFATTYWGPFSKHLNDLVASSKKGLCALFRHCLHFPDNDEVSDATLAQYLKVHKYHNTFNSRFNCITKQDVSRERDLRAEIENYMDEAQVLGAFQNLDAVAVKTLIQRHVITRGTEYEWAHQAAKQNLIEIFITYRVRIILVLLVVLLSLYLYYHPDHRLPFQYILALLIIFVVVFILFFAIYFLTRKKNLTSCRPADSFNRKLAATQLHPVLNEMTAAGPLKKGRLRRFFYSTALRLITIFNYSIKVPTVSSIRWLVVDNGKRLLFQSNYPNTTDFYVRDFLVGNTHWGLNFIFTNGLGFPDALLLFIGGIRKEPEGYMHAVHTGQHITDLWYAHEPCLTAEVINKNRKIRNGLFKKMNETEAKQWLKLL